MSQLLKPSRRAAQVQPFHVMRLLAKATAMADQGRDIIHMEAGEPDFPTPKPIVNAAGHALDVGATKYTNANGLPQLRDAISGWYQTHYGFAVDPVRIAVTPGASGALQLALLAVLDAGDGLLICDPGYPCNREGAAVLGIETAEVRTRPEQGYQPTIDDVQAAWQDNTRALMLASPNNPAGGLVDAEQLSAMARFTAEQGAFLIVDELYHGLIYGEHPATALSLGDHVIVVNSFSKFFGMTGWRLGWIVVPEALSQAIERMAQHLFLAPSTIAQHAAMAAFEPETLAILIDRRDAFRARRDYLLPALRSMGFDIPVEPAGAFYIYADAAAFTQDSDRFCLDMLEHTGVVATPGIDFGTYRCREHVRFAYTTSMDRLEEGVRRMQEYLRS